MNYDLDTEEGMRHCVQWTQGLVNSIEDEGVWAVPRSGTVIRIDKATKTATIVTQDAPDPSIERVFIKMGWSIEKIPSKSPPTDQPSQHV